MLNIISRSILFKNVSGPKKVVENLIKGLDLLGYPYVVNKCLDCCNRLYIHDDRVALKEVAGLDLRVKVIVGPNLYVVPRDIPKELDISKAVYLVPSEWNKSFWLHFGFDKCQMEAWPTGIDTEEFMSSADKKEFILIYWKQRSDWELEKVRKSLEDKNLVYKILHYDEGYKEEEFKKLLKKTRYVIWLGRQESQGIALQEVLSSNVPILVCDVLSVGHCIGGHELNQAEKDFKNTTSAQYFDDKCGIKIKDLDFVDQAIDNMESGLGKFEPRKYILENLSLEKQAREFLAFYEKHFGLSYESGFKEKLLRDGDWVNNKLYYIFYLRLKHFIKMFFVKIGIWNYVWKLLNK